IRALLLTAPAVSGRLSGSTRMPDSRCLPEPPCQVLSTCLLRRLAAGAAAVVLGLGPMQAAAASAAAGPHQNETPTARLVDFDLPVMALKDALARYSLLTRYSVLFESDMVTGKQSASVRGGHTAEAALSRLLAGTGLVPRFLNRHSVALVPAGQ